jgi:GTP cyclohydrolase II
MRTDSSVESILLGGKDLVGVSRVITELRAKRPVIIRSAAESLVALPVEGLGTRRLAAFAKICAPDFPRLVVTARRALALGVMAAAPVMLRTDAVIDAETILALAADRATEQKFTAEPAGEAAVAAIELVKLAQVLPAVLVTTATPAKLAAFDEPLVTVDAEAVAGFRQNVLQSLTMAGEAKVPLNSGVATRFVVFRDALGECPVAVIVGKPDLSRPVPVRLHSACLTGDVFGSRRCDCGDQLKLSLKRLAAEGGGIILYLVQEGRALGLSNKMRTYQLQDSGLDTVDANTTLGFDDDERDYGIAARMLQMLGCNQVLLLTNNPAKLNGLAEFGIEIAGRLPIETPINSDNLRYLTAKAARSGHRLENLVAALAEIEAEPTAASMAG